MHKYGRHGNVTRATLNVHGAERARRRSRDQLHPESGVFGKCRFLLACNRATRFLFQRRVIKRVINLFFL